MLDYSVRNRRIAYNTVMLYIRMFFILIISLYSSRVILNTLGVSDYGVYNVVFGFVSFFGFLNATLSASMQRYFNYEGTKHGNEGYSNVYNSGLLIHLVLAVVVMILLETGGVYYLKHLMVIPPDRTYAARVLFQAAVFSMIFVIIQTPYLAIVMATENMGFYAIVSVIEVIAKLIIALSLAHVTFDRLVSYGLLSMGVTIIIFLLYFIYCKCRFEYIKVKMGNDLKLLRGMLSFSAWNLVGTFAFMLKGQGINMLLNFFFGPVVNAARGVAFQVSGAVGSFSSNISVSYRPQIVNSYSENDYGRTRSLLFSESKICYFLILILLIPVIIEMDFLLGLWLGDNVPEGTGIYASLVLVDVLVCSLNTPITQIVMATGKITGYQIASSVVNLLLLPSCFVFLRMGFSAESVYWATIAFSILNQFVCVSQARRVFSLSVIDYLKQVIIPCLIITLLIPLLPLLLSLLSFGPWVRLFVVVLAEFICGVPLVYFIGLNKQEKAIMKSWINLQFRR